MSLWIGEKEGQPPDEPLVSICCITYNHEHFIADALEGFLAQQTPFPVEILVHDDASTDRTAAMVLEYERRHPDTIRAICQTENQYSKGTRTSHFNFERARGQYIALCEGDDYWTDPCKLALQVAALAAHPEVSLCFHAARHITHGDNTGSKVIGRYARGDALIRVEDVINHSHGSIPTASCVVRKTAIDELLKFRAERCRARVGDVVMEILASLAGGALYIDREMSVYRFRTPGSWSTRQSTDAEQRMRYARDRIEIMRALDTYSEGKYSLIFSRQIRRRIASIASSELFLQSQKWAFFKEYRSMLDFPGQMRYLAKTLLTMPRKA